MPLRIEPRSKIPLKMNKKKSKKKKQNPAPLSLVSFEPRCENKGQFLYRYEKKI